MVASIPQCVSANYIFPFLLTPFGGKTNGYYVAIIRAPLTDVPSLTFDMPRPKYELAVSSLESRVFRGAVAAPRSDTPLSLCLSIRIE